MLSRSLEKSTRELKILVVAADAVATSKEMLEQEIETIKESVNSNYYSLIFDCVSTLNRKDLFKIVDAFKPDILNITGHGSPQGKIIFENDHGWITNITGKTFVKILDGLSKKPECILLNSCQFYRNISAIVEISSNVISIKQRWDGVDLAPTVSRLFYEKLKPEIPYIEAFEMALDEFGPEVKTNVFYKSLPLEDAYAAHQDVKENLWKKSSVNFDEGIDDNESESADGGGPPTERSGPRLYRVWYGTNRKPLDESDLAKGFGCERSRSSFYGYCDVIIPKYHTIGSVGDSWWKRLPFFWRSNKLTVKERVPLAEKNYWEYLSNFILSQSLDERSLLIFLHGYNVSFDGAAIRAAQLGVDLSVRGATAFFSWPSKANITSYAADIAAIEASEGALGDYICRMATEVKAETVHLIVHSMGNRGLLRAFSRIFENIALKSSVHINQIFLAAPDVDADVFENLASIYPQISQRTTMYVSSRDKALALSSSGAVHDYARAGFAPPITVVNGIDTIEVTKIDLSFLGHGYIASARPVLEDIHNLMINNNSPINRFALKQLTNTSGQSYWQLCP